MPMCALIRVMPAIDVEMRGHRQSVAEPLSVSDDATMRDEPPRTAYGPDYGPRVEWENGVLLEALQASQGQIGVAVRGLAVEAGYERVVVHACVSTDDADTRQDLEEMVHDMESALEAMVDPMPTVELRMHVGDTDVSWSGYHHRRLYLMHWRGRGDYVPGSQR
jgi:hypothetical protein